VIPQEFGPGSHIGAHIQVRAYIERRHATYGGI